MCGTAKADYAKLEKKISDMSDAQSIPWDHVIVDEGQDFGKKWFDDPKEDEAELYSKRKAEMDILQTLRLAMEMKDGSFYVFYDQLQMVQSKVLPQFIQNADCKVTLYKNCRNTKNIAITSFRPITTREPKMYDGAESGVQTEMAFCSDDADELGKIDRIIAKLEAAKIRNIVILTLKTENKSIMSERTDSGKLKYKNKYVFTTCRKFKGLEAEAVIIVDIERKHFYGEDANLFYVASSRARINLSLVTEMTDEDCTDVLTNCFKKASRIRRPRTELISALNAAEFNG